MGLNRMMMKNGNSIDVFIAYIDRTIRQFEDNALITVGDYAFYDCNSLTSINLPNVTTVGDYAFGSCYSLTSINLPNVTTVGEDAFSSCKSLTSINLPNVTTVGDYAFYDCNSLMEIHFAVKNKEAIEALSDYSNKFGATNATIYFDL